MVHIIRKIHPYPYSRFSGVRINDEKQLLSTLAASVLLLSASVVRAQDAPSRTECIAPAKPGGGFDLTCKLIQVSLLETKAIEKPMRVTYMPGGVGAVAYNAIVAQRPAEAGTVVAFSGGSLLNLSQGNLVVMT